MELSTDDKLRHANQALQKFTTNLDWGSVVAPRHESENAERVKVYDDNAEVYDEDMTSFQYGAPKHVAETIHKYVKGNKETKMLDVGCGTGLAAKHLQMLAAYNEIDRLEPAAQMLNRGLQNGYYRKGYCQFFGLDSGIDKDTYDVVFSVGAFIPNHIKAEAVKEMCRIAKPGGLVIISTRAAYILVDEDLAQLVPIIQEMEGKGEIKIVDDHEYDNHFVNQKGRLFVLQKI